jgi:EAL domain-containing protein (putative c-di-GMP-specific phosphodiesterase class I)
VRTRAILETSIQLAKRLGLRTVAEGVETEEELHLVRELGCDYAQGYYFSPALAAQDLLRWVAARQPPS